MAGVAMVTGACGFLGRHAARRLAAEGWRVVGIGHGDWTAREASRWGIAEWHAANVTPDELAACATEPGLILHCAGSGSVAFSISDPYRDLQRTVGTTAAVLEFARLRAPSAALVLPSSGAVYGATDGTPIPEAHALDPVSPYGVHKRVAEELCRSAGRHHGLRTAVVRYFSVYGPELRKQVLWDASRIVARGGNGFFGTGHERRDLIHVADAVGLMLLAAGHASTESPAINGGTGVATPVRELLSELFHAFGRSDEPIFNERKRSGDPPVYVASIDVARSWGWAPAVQWREGVREYARWFRTVES
jgi:UDP-glucose 4-epimerase